MFDEVPQTYPTLPEVMSPASDISLVCAFELVLFAGMPMSQARALTHLCTFAGKMYACQYCDAVFAQSIELSRHVRTHTGDKPYVCRDCGKGFRQANGLSIHLHTFHSTYCNRRVRHHGPHLAPRRPMPVIAELSLRHSWVPFGAFSSQFCKNHSPLVP